MRICLVSEFSGVRDEGMRNIAYNLDRQFSRTHDILHLRLRPMANVLSPSFWVQLRRFRPQIIYFIPGATVKGFMLLKALHTWSPQSKAVMGAANPVLSPHAARLLRWLRPNLVVTYSRERQNWFCSLGFPACFSTLGVDSDTFLPVGEAKRKELRLKHGLPASAFIVMHAGPLKARRNVSLLSRIREKTGALPLIVGSVSTPAEEGLWRELERDCVVWHRYVDNIAEVYALSDCYVFPTVEHGQAIEMPLSVMEAMSCNLPVISTPYGGLPDVFPEGDGLFFARHEADFFAKVEAARTFEDVQTRRKVLDYSWTSVAVALEHMFEDLVHAQ